MRTSREVWIKRVQRWQDSGLTAKEFASELGVKASTLTHWKWQLGKEGRDGKRPGAQACANPEQPARCGSPAVTPSLIEVQLPAARQDSYFELDLTHGRRLRVPASFDESALRRLLAVLEEAA